MSAESQAGLIPDEPQSALPPTAALAARVSRSPLLIALDIDGTLAPIAPTPEAAAIPASTRKTLERLARARDVHLALVTGRAALDGRRLVAVDDSWTIGNHGIEVIDPTGTLRVNALAEAFAPTLSEAARRLAGPLGGIGGVFVENKTWTLSVHFRLAALADVPRIEQTLIEVARELELRVIHGKKIFELRPPVSINKGTALLELAAALGVSDHRGSLGGSLIYAGDDRTDEDAFRALRTRQWNAVTVHVGEGTTHGVPTEAEFVLPDPLALRELLDWLLTIWERLGPSDA